MHGQSGSHAWQPRFGDLFPAMVGFLHLTGRSNQAPKEGIMENQKIIGNIHHVAVVVRSTEKPKSYFSELLDTEFIDLPSNEQGGLRSVMSPTGLELIEPTRPDSDLAKFMDRRGEGLYALAFTAPDAGRARAKAEKMGVRVVGDVTVDEGPVKGGREIWLHPKDNFGVYVMFCQGNLDHT